MKTVGLISCGKSKVDFKTESKNLYIGDLFKKARNYVEKAHSEWFILSALHGLVKPNDFISPYEYTLNGKSKSDKVEWAEIVLKEIVENVNPLESEIYIYSGESYRKYLVPLLIEEGYTVKLPLVDAKTRGMGDQKAWFKKNTEE